MNPDDYCRQKAAASGSSFYYSFLFLPDEQRRAITALYAFCREVDDVVDDCSDAGVARMKLAWWRNEIAAAYHGTPQHPVARAVAALRPRFNLPEERLSEIIAGMEMDLDLNRYPDFEALKLYCHRVASVVGKGATISLYLARCTAPHVPVVRSGGGRDTFATTATLSAADGASDGICCHRANMEAARFVAGMEPASSFGEIDADILGHPEIVETHTPL
jgi:hypothetical protein